MSAALAAVEDGDIRKLQSLLKANQQLVREKNKDGQTLLMLAAVNGHVEIAELLLKQKDVSLNEIDKDGRSAVFLAAKNGNYEVVKLLTANRLAVKIDGTDHHGDSILIGPARSGFSIIVQHLLELHRGADPNLQDKDGWTPLMVAAYRGQKDVVECLLENNASVALTSYTDCTTAMKEAVKGRHVEVIQMLADAEIKLDKQNDELYHCKTGEEAMELIRANVSVNQVKGDGKTPLMCHAERGNTDICEVLLQHGAHIDQQDREGQSALMKACYRGDLPTVNLLIMKQCIVDLKTRDDWTALMLAVEQGHTDVVKALVLARANIVIRNKDGGQTALDIAEVKGHQKIIQFLKDRSKATQLQEDIINQPFATQLETYVGDKRKEAYSSVGPLTSVEPTGTGTVSKYDPPKRGASHITTTAPMPKTVTPSVRLTTALSTVRDKEDELSEELKLAQEKVANLETRVQELTLRTTMDPPDEDLTHLPLDRMKEELLKAREMKKKMEKYATDAKQAAQRLSAENHKLREQVYKEQHAHELHWKNLLREVEQKMEKATSNKELSSNYSGKLAQAASIRSRDITELPKHTITPREVKNLLFEDKQHTALKMDMFLLVFSGLPTSGKTTLFEHFNMDHDLLEDASLVRHPAGEQGLGIAIHELGYLRKSLDPIPLWVTSTGKDIIIFMMALAIIKKCAHEKKSPSFSLDVNTSDMSRDISSAFQSPLLQENLRFILERIKTLVPELVKRTNKHLSVETLVTSRLSIFNCWDVGVCRAMYTILPLLANVSKRLFLINLLDLSRDGSDLFMNPKLEGYDDNNYLMQLRSRLHYLLRIAGLTRETAMSVIETLCTTIVVANIRQDSKTEKEMLKEFLRDVSTAIFQKADDVGISALLYPDVLALDVSNPEHAVHVQRILEEVLKLAKCLEVDMPLHWMFFRTALYDHDHFYITKTELSAMAAECHIHREEELLQFLSLFTHIGSLLYFPAVFGEYIVLRPQGFFEAINKLFYPKDLIEDGHKKVLGNGFLCNVTAEKLWKKESPLFMDLLCESGLACDLSRLPSKQSQYCEVCPASKVTRCLYIPALRMDTQQTTDDSNTDSSSAERRQDGRRHQQQQEVKESKSLYVTFNTEYIPTSLETTIIKYLGLALVQDSSDEDYLTEQRPSAKESWSKSHLPVHQEPPKIAKQPQFLIDFDFKTSTYSCTVLKLIPVPGSKFFPLGLQVIVSIDSHGDVLEVRFHFERATWDGKRSRTVSEDDLENYFYSLLKNLVVGALSKVLVYFKDVKYQLAFPCPSVSERDQAKRLGHYIYFHPHDPRTDHLFCYHKRDPDLKRQTDHPSDTDSLVTDQYCMKYQPLSPRQQKWMAARCTFTDGSSLYGLDENDKLEPTELRDLAERLTSSTFCVPCHGHTQNSSSLDPVKHIKLCEDLLHPHIPKHTYILEKIKVLHQTKTPADLVTAALKEWQNISPAHTKQKLAAVLFESGYYSESLQLDAKLINKKPSSVPVTTKELSLVSIHTAAKWKELAKLLHLSPAEIKTIKQSTPKTKRRKVECCLKCLEQWRQRLKTVEEVEKSRDYLSKCLKQLRYFSLCDMLAIAAE